MVRSLLLVRNSNPLDSGPRTAIFEYLGAKVTQECQGMSGTRALYHSYQQLCQSYPCTRRCPERPDNHTLLLPRQGPVVGTVDTVLFFLDWGCTPPPPHPKPHPHPHSHSHPNPNPTPTPTPQVLGHPRDPTPWFECSVRVLGLSAVSGF